MRSAKFVTVVCCLLSAFAVTAVDVLAWGGGMMGSRGGMGTCAGMGNFGGVGTCGGYGTCRPYCFPTPFIYQAMPAPVYIDETYVLESTPSDFDGGTTGTARSAIDRLGSFKNSLPNSSSVPSTKTTTAPGDLTDVISDVFGKSVAPKDEIAALTVELASDPKASTYFRRALACAKAGRLDDAKADLKKCTSLDPRNPDYHMELGVLNSRTQSPKEALDCFNKALSLKPGWPECLYQKSVALVRDGSPREAINCLDQVLAQEPRCGRCLYTRALALQKLGKAKDALADAKLAAALLPSDPAVQFLLGQTLAADGKPADAVAPLRESINRRPDSVEQRRALLSALMNSGQLAAAVKEITNLIDSGADADHGLLLLRGNLLFQLTQYYAAVADYSLYLQHQPDTIEALANRASAYYELGSYKLAYADFSQVLNLIAKDPQKPNASASMKIAVHYRRCFNAYMLGDAAQAAVDADSGLASAGWTNEHSPYFALCGYIAYVKLGKPDKARAILQNALANCSKTAWPYPIFRYFNREIDDKALMLAAAGAKARTEAHVYAGLYQVWSGQAAGKNLLEWTRANGETGIPEYLLAMHHLFPPKSAAKQDVSRPTAQRWALVVGVSKFKEPSINLRFCDKDAADFAEFLTASGGFDNNHVRKLLNEEATRENILSALGNQWLPRLTNKDDLVLLYVSTHGSPSSMDLKGANYLVAHDTDPTNLSATGLSLQDLTRMVRDRVHSDRVIVILDACHSGAAADSPTDKTKMQRDLNIDAATAAAESEQVVICSSRPDELSWESKHVSNGVFTHYLIEGFKSNSAGATLAEAFDFTRKKVEQEVQQDRGAHQTPVLKSSWTNNDVKVTGSPTASQQGASK